LLQRSAIGDHARRASPGRGAATAMSELTRLLHQLHGGEGDDAAIAALYDEIRRLARAYMRGERADHTLVPTALANEAWMRLFGETDRRFDNGAEFFAAVATTLRRVLVEHSRRRASKKRGGGVQRSDLDADMLAAPSPDAQVLAVDAALERLATLDPGKARLVELRYFAGLSVDEVAVLLGMSPRSVARDWRLARAFLRAELAVGEDGDALDR
jgi:RNA polymerase sigma factor (TIGR02999 family)